MDEYVGLDVSKEDTCFCVMDAEGKVLAQGKALSDGFTPKQIDAPETIFCVADECQPRRASSAGPWPVVFLKNPPHHVLVYLDTKRL